MSKKMIALKSSGGEFFEIEEAVALQSQRIAHMVEDDGADNVIPLENVTSQVLKKVIEYCKKHVHVAGGDSSSEAEEDLKKWDAEFMDIDQSMMFNLILAADYLDIKVLRDLTATTIADTISACKSAEEIRSKF